MSDIERRLRDLGERVRAEQPSATLPPRVTRRVKRRRWATIGASLVLLVGVAFGGAVAVGAFEPPAEIGPAETTSDVLIDYHRTGGFAGEDTRLVVHTDGTALTRIVDEGQPITTHHRLHDADLRGLEAAMSLVDWPAVDGDHEPGPGTSVADAIEFELRHDHYAVSGYYRFGPAREVTALVGYLDTLLGNLRTEPESSDLGPSLSLSETTVHPGDVVDLQIEAPDRYTWGALTSLDAQRSGDWERLYHWATYVDGSDGALTAFRRGGVNDIGYSGPATFQLQIPQLESGRYRITKDFIRDPVGGESLEERTVVAEVGFDVVE